MNTGTTPSSCSKNSHSRKDNLILMRWEIKSWWSWMNKWIVSKKKLLTSKTNHLRIWIECMITSNCRLVMMKIWLKDIQNIGKNRLINQNRNLSEKCRQPNSSKNSKQGKQTRKFMDITTRQSTTSSSMTAWLYRRVSTTQMPLLRELRPLSKLCPRKGARA